MIPEELSPRQETRQNLTCIILALITPVFLVLTKPAELLANLFRHNNRK